MQENATSLEGDRKSRLAELEEKERKQREEEDRVRSDRGRFVGKINKQAETVDLGARLQGRAGLQKMDD